MESDFSGRPQKGVGKWAHFFMVACVGIALGVILKLFVVDFLHVSGRSMLPTIAEGETIVVNRLAYGLCRPYSAELLLRWSRPRPNDVVIYLYDDRIVVKRVVAVSGEPLEFSADGASVLVAGRVEIPLSEIQRLNMEGSSAVPEGYVLAVGDNYAESIDSRTYGFVPEKNILGKVLCK